MSEKILTLHPEGREGVNIDKARYDAVREAVLAAIRAQGDMPFGSLADAVGQRLPDFRRLDWLVHDYGQAGPGSAR
jgi:hypothetical protein